MFDSYFQEKKSDLKLITNETVAAKPIEKTLDILIDGPKKFNNIYQQINVLTTNVAYEIGFNSSFIMQGFIRGMLSKNEEAVREGRVYVISIKTYMKSK